LVLIFEGECHYQGKRQEVGRKKKAGGRVLGRRSCERKEPLDNNDGIMKATESPWFLVKGKNILVREVIFSFTSTCCTRGPGIDLQGEGYEGGSSGG
jgi:hypothetical protein